MRSPADPTAVSVIVPTYRRVADLERCLDALGRQTLAPLEVIVVAREDDLETAALLDRRTGGALPLRRAHPPGGGVVAAYNAGLDAAEGGIVAITDDDAAPRPDWLARIVARFADDPMIGGVGGRDALHIHGQRIGGTHARVGEVQWFGRTFGNHHLGCGPAREVDILKGVNMSFRVTALAGRRFDQRMRGPGAQVDCELAFSLALRRAGWRLIYDPAIVVDHYQAPRHDIDQRDGFSFEALANQAHNETLALLDHLPPGRRAAFMAFASLVGTRAVPGLLQTARLPLLGVDRPLKRLAASLRGRAAGWRTWRAGRPGTAPEPRSPAPAPGRPH